MTSLEGLDWDVDTAIFVAVDIEPQTNQPSTNLRQCIAYAKKLPSGIHYDIFYGCPGPPRRLTQEEVEILFQELSG